MLPILFIEGRTLPEVWEKSILELWERGIPKRTEYDKPGDPPSKEATTVLVIHRPLEEPRLHRCFPGALADLETYRQEVVDGLHDHWVRTSETAWTYTYHQRLTAWNADNDPPYFAGDLQHAEGKAPWVKQDTGGKVPGAFVDQVEYVLTKLADSPHTRRAQAVTWNALIDPETDDPPCLQRMWFTITGQDGKDYLNLNTHWRSRDAFKAAFMNIWAFIDWLERLAGELSERRGKPVEPGRYVDMVDSYHIYGSYFREFEGFLKTVRSRTFEERTWSLAKAKELGMFDA